MFDIVLKNRLFPVLLAVACLTVPVAGQAVPDSEPPPPPRSPSVPSAPSDPEPDPEPIEVELELALMVDSSSSVDDAEFTLQRQGYVDAFRDPEVQAAIVALDGVVVRYWEWSGNRQRTSFGDQLLETEADCNTFALLIGAFDRHYANSTNMAAALNIVRVRQGDNRYISRRQVIDVSGDGVCENEFFYRDGRPLDESVDLGLRWQDVRDRLPDTTTVNGISIGMTPGVANWYSTEVPFGQRSFALNVSTFAEFGEAIKVKLLREIVSIPVSYD